VKFHFHPKLLDVWREGYTFTLFKKDLVAGVIVGMMALPLAIGFGVASVPGPVPPDAPSPAAMGLYTAIAAGLIVALLGGSRVQVAGPTGAFIPVVALIVYEHGLGGLWLATFLAGIILILLGLVRAGSFSRFIPLPVVIGFTSGIGVIIVLQQLKDLLGLRPDKPLSPDTIERLKELWGALGTFHGPTALVAVLGLAAIFLIPEKWSPRLAVLFGGTLLANLFGLVSHPGDPGLATIGSTFGHPLGNTYTGAIPGEFPPIQPLYLSLDLIRPALPAAFTIAFLAGLESVLAALATDKMVKDRHDPDQELMAQGAANLVVPWLGGLPVTGAIARSSANVQSGGSTPVAAVIHALVLLLVLWLAGPVVAHVPMVVLAVILVHVAFRMLEVHHFELLRRVTRIELAVAAVTFLMTVLVDLNMGVAFGLAVSAVVMVIRLREITVMREVPLKEAGRLPSNLNSREMLILRLEGVFFYAVADDLPLKVEEDLKKHPELRVLVLQASKMLAVDFHGVEVLGELHRSLKRRDVHLILCGAQPHPSGMLHRHGFLDELGLDNLCGDLDSALGRASLILDVPRGELFKG
jgi:SulP family sulfate permease